ncbi:MAG: hypothetical protein IJ571_06895 [Ruminococcus sp.]|nr:hypothetical protein [Ruminococcus sp.]
MKLNYRDKVVLIVLAVLLILVGGFVLFVKPAIDDCNTASDTLETKKVELADLKEKNKKDANLKTEIKEIKAKTTEITDNFYGYQVNYKVQDTLSTLFSADGVDIEPESITLTPYGSTILSPYLYVSDMIYTDIDRSVEQYDRLAAGDSTAMNDDTTTDASSSTDSSNAVSIQAIGCYEISCDFNSTYDGFKTFAQNLTTNREKSMVIKDVTIDDVNGKSDDDDEDEEEAKKDKEEEAPTIHGSMTMQMIVLKKISN